MKSLVDSVRSRVDLPFQPVVVALSGGADSAALAWLVQATTHPARGIHIHHGWPGSERMASAARAVAGRLGMPLEVIPVEVGAGPSPEAQARQVRYAALTAALRPEEVVITGHTADDQAETVLANLLRGTGLDGLAGIPAHRDRIHRPLLRVRRDELRELAVLARLPFQEDPANFDLTLRRNYIRRRLLADLEQSVAPGASTSLARLGALVADEVAFLEREAERRGGDGLDAPVLAVLPVALARRAVRAALGRAGAGHGLRAQDVDKVLEVARRGGEIGLPSGHVVRRSGARLVVEPRPEAETRPIAWDWLGSRVVAPDWRIEGHITAGAPAHFSLSAWSEVFDADAVPATVTIRPPAAGDTIRLRSGTKAVRAALAEAGVEQPDRWPVVASGHDVIWIPGVRRGFLGWVGSGTRRYLCVEAVREGQ